MRASLVATGLSVALVLFFFNRVEPTFNAAMITIMHTKAQGSDTVYEKSVNLLENASSRQPDNPRIWYWIGRLRLELGDMQPARDALLQAQRYAGPDDPLINLELGNLEWAVGHSEMAIHYWRIGGAGGYYLVQGRRAELDGDFMSAAAWYELATQIDPIASLGYTEVEVANVYVALGRVYMRLGEWEKAEENLLKAVQNQPHNPIPYKELGALYLHLGDSRRAAEVLQRGVEQTPSDMWTLLLLSEAYMIQGNLTGAEQVITLAAQVMPQSDAPYWYFGVLELRRADPARAASYLEEAVRRNPQNASAYERLGVARMSIGDVAGAVDAFQLALAINSSFVQAYLGLGQALERQGLMDNAIWAYQSALRLDPGNAIAAERLAALRPR